MSYPVRNLVIALVGLTPAMAAPGLVGAQTREVFPLGRSAASGAVCQAVRDYDDPLAQPRGAQAWRVQCRGYRTALGRIYSLPGGAEESWRRARATRAVCEDPRPANLPGVSTGGRAACRAAPGQTPYVAYEARRGRRIIAAEGYAPIADVLETGLRVAAGVAKPPPPAEAQASRAQAEIAADFPDIGGLAAAEAAASDMGRLRMRGYVQNNEWNFDEAETAFRAIAASAQAENLAPAVRAEGLLNLALNVSNNGRFAEADAFFRESEPLVAAARDSVLQARALNYRALHARNQGRLGEAVDLARRALLARAAAHAAGLEARDAVGVEGDAPGVRLREGTPVIDATTARALNVRSGATDLLVRSRLTPADELAIQDAQAHELIGSVLAENGDPAGARAAFLRARDILAGRESLGLVTAWLRARVEADLAGLELAAGRPDAAAQGYGTALALLRTRHAGSAGEGGLLLDLGRAQAAAGRSQEALAAFDRARVIFTEQRGGYGASVDAAQPYFDLLLELIRTDPGHAEGYAARFFEAAEAGVGSATARTVSLLAARVAASDTATAGLARALEDARSEVRAAERRVATLQLQRGDDAERAAADDQLKRLQREADVLEGELLALNPRYNQLVNAAAPAKELQQALRPDEAYLKILVLAGRSYGVLVTPTAIRPYAIGLGREQVNAEVSSLRAPFEAKGDSVPAFDVAASARLFDQLAGPVRADLLRTKHLIYEPDGALIGLPVATLVIDPASVELIRARRRPRAPPDYRGVAWLGSRMASSLVLSGASFLQSRRFAASKAQHTYLGFGDPVLPRSEPRAYASLLDLSGRRSAAAEAACGPTRTALLQIAPLPETAGEVRAVGESLGAPEAVVLGASFNDSALKGRSDLADFRVLYFATHGLLPQPDACLPEPALVTSLGGEGSDALLEASEIVDLDLDADLVVLAACDTGGGGAGRGEALGGLSRAMIYAGSRGLIVSHWAVDSGSAVRVLTGLFRSGATTQAEGLRRAQAELQAKPVLSHPFFWAPFTVVGDGARPLPRR